MALASLQSRYDQLLLQLSDQEVRIAEDRTSSAAVQAQLVADSVQREREWEDAVAGLKAEFERQVCALIVAFLPLCSFEHGIWFQN